MSTEPTPSATVSRANALIIGAIAAVVCLIAGIGIGAVAFGGSGAESSSTASSPTSAPAYEAASTTTTTPAVPPAPADFAVDVTVTEQKCFGSAGCNYVLSINPRYIGLLGLTTGKYQVIYEIIGGDDPQTGNFNVDGTNVRWDQEKRIQGSQGSTFSANVIQVLAAY